MWNPFRKARERREAEAKRIAEIEAKQQAAKLASLNAALAAARAPTGYFKKPSLSAVPPVSVEQRRVQMENELTAQRAYRQDMQRRALAEDSARTQNHIDDMGMMQAQAFINSLQTGSGSSDSYTPAGSCSSSSSSSDSSSSSTSSSSDCGSSSSDSGSSGGCD